MEGLMMDKRVSLVVVGQDVLKPNDKVMLCTCTVVLVLLKTLAEVNVYDSSFYLISMLDFVP